MLAEFCFKLNFSIRQDRFSISIGSTASVPYVSLNGVSPVLVWAVLLYDHKMAGSSSGQRPLASSNLLFIPIITALFADSAWPFVCGCSTEAYLFWMPIDWQYSVVYLLTNCWPLSEIISIGVLN